jgi:uncharacterized ferritin-like protein (DUF455 family)
MPFAISGEQNSNIYQTERKSDKIVPTGPAHDVRSSAAEDIAMQVSLNQHLDEVGETYGEHFVHAGSYGVTLVVAGLACLVHAALPFLFERTGSDAIRTLHGRMASRGRMDPPTAAELMYQI